MHYSEFPTQIKGKLFNFSSTKIKTCMCVHATRIFTKHLKFYTHTQKWEQVSFLQCALIKKNFKPRHCTLNFLKFCVCRSVYRKVHVSAGTPRSQRCLIPNSSLPAVGQCLTWVLGAVGIFSAGAVLTFKHSLSSALHRIQLKLSDCIPFFSWVNTEGIHAISASDA